MGILRTLLAGAATALCCVVSILAVSFGWRWSAWLAATTLLDGRVVVLGLASLLTGIAVQAVLVRQGRNWRTTSYLGVACLVAVLMGLGAGALVATQCDAQPVQTAFGAPPPADLRVDSTVDVQSLAGGGERYLVVRFVTTSPEFPQFLAAQGFEPAGGTPVGSAAALRAQLEVWRYLIATLGWDRDLPPRAELWQRRNDEQWHAVLWDCASGVGLACYLRD